MNSRIIWSRETWNGITVLANTQDIVDGKPLTRENTRPVRHSFIGGYPIAYHDLSGIVDTLCPDCMHRDGNEDGTFEAFINYECEWLHCEECGIQIEYAYPSEEAGRD